jgi:hypothetical protein
MHTTTKCANPPCDCPAQEGSEYCSAYCAGAEERTSVACHCGHATCDGDLSEVETGKIAGSNA